MSYFIAVLLLLTVAIILLFLLITIIDPIYFLLFTKIFAAHFYPFGRLKLTTIERNIIKNNITFYRNLTLRKRLNFDHRVSKFLNKYKIVGNDVAIDREKELLIAAIYVKLTFGMRSYLIGNFSTIIVYPEAYYNTLTKNHHKGEFNPSAKIIALSWKDFLHGIEHPDDNYNLGIHEFTHALHNNSNKNKSFDALNFRNYFKEIETYFTNPKKLELIQNQQFFRDYAFTNKFEFLAVLIEYYFESPKEFKTVFPVLYKNISGMLGMDLLRTSRFAF